jgi:isochorismate synthase
MAEILYRLPESKEIRRFQVDKVEEIDFSDLNRATFGGFVIAPFNKKNSVLFCHGHSSEMKESDLDNLDFTITEEYVEHNLDSETYKDLVHDTVKQLGEGVMTKVVLAKSEFVKDYINPTGLFRSMCEEYPHAYVYLFEINDQVWIGASPEMLCRFSNGKGHTVALAGTQPRSSQKWGEKELEEQRIIQEYIEGILNKLPNLNWQKGDTRTIRAGEIEHISSIYHFDCKPNVLPELINELHPTPAVCGTPLHQSRKYIYKNEPLNRSYYSGFLGEWNHNSVDVFVNLRCARIYSNGIEIIAGAGITVDSDPIAESEEVNKKMDTIKRLL